jgi:hypothetical protein
MVSTAREMHGQPSWWERGALACGVVFAAMQLAALVIALAVIVPTHAPLDAPATEAAVAFATHAPLIALGNYLLALPVPFLLLFLGGLHAVLRRAAGGGDAPAAAALAAGVAAAVIGPLGALISGLGARIALAGGDPAVVKELDGMGPLAMALAAFPHAVLVGVVAAVALRGRLAPRWLAWLGLAVGLVGLLATGVLVAPELFPLLALEMLLFPLWILAVSAALLRSARPASWSAARRLAAPPARRESHG